MVKTLPVRARGLTAFTKVTAVRRSVTRRRKPTWSISAAAPPRPS